MFLPPLSRTLAVAVTALCAASSLAAAQGTSHHAPAHETHAASHGGKANGHAKHYVVSRDRAVSVTREVLVKRGFEVVRIERQGPTEIVYYRAGNNGRGRGKGPPARMVIRRLDDRVVFEEAPPAVLVDIDIRLKL